MKPFINRLSDARVTAASVIAAKWVPFLAARSMASTILG